jgi:hypothetical protein
VRRGNVCIGYNRFMNERPSLSLNQAVGVGRPKLKPLERRKILDEGGSPQVGGGHEALEAVRSCFGSC